MARAARRIADKRGAILDAAVALFARKGFHGTNVPEIAALAGVATGSIYRYFATKEALVNAAYAERKRAMLAAFEVAAAGGGDARMQFRRVWRGLVAYAVAHPDDFRFFELHHHESYLDAASREVGADLMAAAVRFVEALLPARRGVDPKPEILVALVWGALVGLMKGADQEFLKLDPATVDMAGQVLWRAVAAGGEPATIHPFTLAQERPSP